MTFGIQSFIENPLLSLGISLIIFFGIFELGRNIIKILDIYFLDRFYFYGLVGYLFSSTNVYVWTILTEKFSIISWLFFFICLVLVLSSLRKYWYQWQRWRKELNKAISDRVEKICLVIVFGYFLGTLGPLTEADSLRYHLTYAQSIVNNDGYVGYPHWFHSLLVGSGESVIALGLSVGAFHLGSMVQVFGVLAILGAFKQLTTSLDPNSSATNSLIYFSWLAILTSPVIVQLIFSIKPQLNAIGAIVVVFTWSICIIFQLKVRPKSIISFLVMTFLLTSAVLLKMSFLISSLFCGLLILICLQDSFNRLRFIFFSPIIFVYCFMPLVYWRMSAFELDLISALLFPFTSNIAGVSEFLNFLKEYRAVNLPFPIGLFFPSNIGEITSVASPLFLLLLILISFKKSNFFWVLFFFIYFISLTIFGQKSARFFLEFLICVAVFTIVHVQTDNRWLWQLPPRVFEAVGYSVALSVLLLGCWMGYPSMGSDFTADRYRSSVNGYSAIEGLGSIVGDSSSKVKILTDFNYLSLFGSEAHDSDWLFHTPKIALDYHLDDLKLVGFSHLVVSDLAAVDLYAPLLEDCGSQFDYTPISGQTAVRNPFVKPSAITLYVIELCTAPID